MHARLPKLPHVHPKVRLGIGYGLDAGFAAMDYKHYRKNHYSRQGAFATAASYAAVGVGSAAAIHRMGVHQARYAIPLGMAAGAVGNRVIGRNVERHFAPKTRTRRAPKRRKR